ncbi:hypothetical protein RSOL_391870 [Rhizoctonia solani AG-3 Rhs1AP]|uniref:Uncharacterized protein n=2 Tax=Rhizoctonia solani AG-3 TaxID=1086053 RepID=A0A074RLZ0_9AGAM|nr:hypothetical protein RSOL_391870 [Rhizoctonia solani AG-3 Rhs1AP]KEP47834.1 hypothetical protein V565_142240 [Rhizoctonia solani 123E]
MVSTRAEVLQVVGSYSMLTPRSKLPPILYPPVEIGLEFELGLCWVDKRVCDEVRLLIRTRSLRQTQFPRPLHIRPIVHRTRLLARRYFRPNRWSETAGEVGESLQRSFQIPCV